MMHTLQSARNNTGQLACHHGLSFVRPTPKTAAVIDTIPALIKQSPMFINSSPQH